MRIIMVAMVVTCSVLGVLLGAGLVAAANIETFARVNLVQGMEATLGSVGQDTDSPDKISDHSLLNISGPANYCVEVQMSALEPQSQWTDRVSPDAVAWDTHHDALGNLNLDNTFDGFVLNGLVTEELAVSSTRYIVTLTYE